MFKVIRSKTFVENYKCLCKHDTKLADKVDRMVSEIIIHPATGIGKPEQLKYTSNGLWSRRIDQKNRLIYEVNTEEKIIIFHYCRGHYEQLR